MYSKLLKYKCIQNISINYRFFKLTNIKRNFTSKNDDIIPDAEYNIKNKDINKDTSNVDKEVEYKNNIFGSYAPSDYNFNSDVWKNSYIYPVLPDYNKLLSCLYADKIEDFAKLPLNFSCALKDSDVDSALANNDIEKAAELVSDPAVIFKKVVELSNMQKFEESKKVSEFLI